jgi:hypothetical protein
MEVGNRQLARGGDAGKRASSRALALAAARRRI